MSCGTLVNVFVRVGGASVMLGFWAAVNWFSSSDIQPAGAGILRKYHYSSGSIFLRISVPVSSESLICGSQYQSGARSVQFGLRKSRNPPYNCVQNLAARNTTSRQLTPARSPLFQWTGRRPKPSSPDRHHSDSMPFTPSNVSASLG